MNARALPICLLFSALGAAFWLSRPAAAHGGEQRISCFAELPLGAAAGKAPPGWQVTGPHAAHAASRSLTSAGMLHGAPEESGYLAPLDARKASMGDRSTWTQRWRFDRPHWYTTFVYCGYGGDRDEVQLFYPIDRNATECTLTSVSKRRVVERMSFVCR